MKIFFAGIPFGIGGPREVNKNLIDVLGNRVAHVKFRNKIVHVAEMFWKIMVSDVIIFSGVSEYDYVFAHFASILRKDVLYIMHGCNKLENEINHFSNPNCEKSQYALMRCAHTILCVSHTHSEIIKEYFSEFKSKISYLTNGVNWTYLDANIGAATNTTRDNNKIVLMGGGRNTKRNLNVCRAVDALNREKHLNLHVDVYGSLRENDESKRIVGIPCVNFKGIVPHSEVLKELTQARLFVQNSEFEPFSLGVIEALLCGCDLLLSKYVGAKDILATEEDDIINNPNNLQEIKEKIEKVLNKSNNERLLATINRQATSIETAGNKLLNIVNTTFKNK